MRTTFKKIAQLARPFAYWPLYGLRRRVRVQPRLHDTGMWRFAAQIRGAFETMHAPGNIDSSRAAERLSRSLCGKVNILGYPEVVAPQGDSWHADEVHGYSWQVKYFPLCDFVAADAFCDVKIPWELSRLHSLLWLAEGAVLAIEEDADRYRSQVFRTIEEWCGANPAGYGVNWVCGMEVAIRAVNIAFSAAVLWRDASEYQQRLVLNCLSDHRSYLRRFPEISDIPGNHYLMDLLGEYVLDLCLDGELSQAAINSFVRFVVEADNQFDGDGEHIERSPVYQRLCIDALAIVLALAPAGAGEAGAQLRSIFARAWSFSERLASPFGRLPAFGDQDSGFILWFRDDARELFDARARQLSGGKSDFWLFLRCLSAGIGCDGVGAARPPAGQVGRYATAEGEQAFVVMKGGEQGLHGRAPHDHDDALSIWVFIGAHDFIVDAGSHSYTLAPQIRRESIVSSAHNGPRRFGIENWTPVVGSVTETVRGAAAGTVVSRGDSESVGTLALADGAAFERAVTIRNVGGRECVLIEDQWSESPRGVEVSWIFDSRWKIVAGTARSQGGMADANEQFSWLLSDGSSIVQVKIRSSSVSLDATVTETRISPVYGLFVTAVRIDASVVGAGSGSLVSEFTVMR